jgi:hypothetical protein
MQVFFYFSGHGADGSGNDVYMYSNDEKRVSFYDLFHEWVTNTGAVAVAVLDCCRVREEPPTRPNAEIARPIADVCISRMLLSLLSRKHCHAMSTCGCTCCALYSSHAEPSCAAFRPLAQGHTTMCLPVTRVDRQ